MSELKYSWQQAVVDAFLASPEDLAGKINLAERMILARVHQPQETDFEEKLALDDARRALKVLIPEEKRRHAPKAGQNADELIDPPGASAENESASRQDRSGHKNVAF